MDTSPPYAKDKLAHELRAKAELAPANLQLTPYEIVKKAALMSRLRWLVLA